MSTKQGVNRKVDATLVKIVSHSVRAEIMEILDTRVASPKQMSVLLDRDVGNVGYHCRCLVALKAIELVRTRQVRGATEHFYRGIKRPEVSEAEYERMSPKARSDFMRSAFQLQTADAAVSLGEGTASGRVDAWAVRVPGFLDDDGWAELAEKLAVAYEGVYEAFAASVARASEARAAGEDAERAIPVMIHLNCFEMPPPMPLPSTE